MGRISNEKKIILLKINKARLILNKYIEMGLIAEETLKILMSNDTNFIFNNYNNVKQKLLKEIYTSPFLLCDQENLSENTKKILPLFLKVRLEIEQEELLNLFNLGFITKEEYDKELDKLVFCYYKSSEDGKKIYKNSQIVKIK